MTLARESIESSLRAGRFVECPYRAFSPQFRQRRSSFVTLRVAGELRGCCGSIDAPRALAEDLWRNAWASAFNDPR
ncbi:MAG: AMMECR1 domain-containing protein, partial [Burkholderiaceae bacterium]